MTDLPERVFSLYKNGVRLWIDSGRLRYSAPTGVVLHEHMEFLKSYKSDIEVLLQETAPDIKGTSLLEKRELSAPHPTSLQQDRLLDRLREFPYSDRYMEYPLLIRGSVNTKFLIASIEETVRSHESLRTRIICIDGMSRQVTASPPTQVVEVQPYGVEGVSRSPHNEALDFLTKFFNATPSWQSSPMLDVRLLCFSPVEHILAVAAHHLISDESSMDIFFQDIWGRYEAQVLGSCQKSSGHQYHLQYRDYTIWQRLTVPGWIRDHGSYWRTRLSRFENLRWPSEQGFAGANSQPLTKLRFSFGKELSASISDLERRERLLPGIAVLTILLAAISRRCSQRDFVIATVVSGRARIDHDKVTGYLAHTVPLRFQVSGRETFARLLRTVADELLLSWQHVDSARPMQKVLNALDVAAYGKLSMIYQWRHTEYVGTSEALDVSSVQDLSIESLPVDKSFPDMPNAPMVWVFFRHGAEICGYVLYSERRFERSLMEQFAIQIQRLAADLINNSEAPWESV